MTLAIKNDGWGAMVVLAFVAALLVALTAPAAAERPDWRGLIESGISDYNAAQRDLLLSFEGMALTEEDETSAVLVFDAITLSFDTVTTALSGPGRLTLSLDPDGLMALGPASLDGPITITGPPDSVPVTFDFTLKNLDGRYDLERRLLRKLLVALDGVAVERGEGLLFAAESLSLLSIVTPDQRGLYDRSILVSATTANVLTPKIIFGSEGLVLRSEDLGVDADAVSAMLERLDASKTSPERPSLPPLDALRREDFLSIEARKLWALDRDARQIRPEAFEENLFFWLDGMRVESLIERGSAVDSFTLKLVLQASGLLVEGSVDPTLESIADLVPDTWRIPLTLQDLPSGAVTRLLQDLSLGSSVQTGPVFDPELRIDHEAFLQAVQQAGSRLLIEDLLISGPAGSISAQGDLSVDRRHPLSLVGEASLLLDGPAWIAEALTRDEEGREALEGAFAITTLLKGLGQAEFDEAGKLAYRYGLELGTDGTILVNGLPLRRLLER